MSRKYGIKIDTMYIEKGLSANANRDLLFGSKRNEAESARIGNSFDKTISSMYLGFALDVEKAIVLYSCRKIF